MEPAEPMAPASGPELTPAWRTWGRLLATTGAIAFAVTALILLLDNLHVFVKPPDLPDATRLPDRLIAILEYESQHFPIALLNVLVAIVSFAALEVLDLASPIQRWSIAWTLVPFAGGVLLIASVGRGWLAAPAAGLRLSMALGSLMLLVAVATLGFPPLADALGWRVDPGIVTGVP